MKYISWLVSALFILSGIGGLAIAAIPSTMELNICRTWCGEHDPEDPPDYERICPEGKHCCLNANCAIMEFASSCCDSPNLCKYGTSNGLPTASCVQPGGGPF